MNQKLSIVVFIVYYQRLRLFGSNIMTSDQQIILYGHDNFIVYVVNFCVALDIILMI